MRANLEKRPDLHCNTIRVKRFSAVTQPTFHITPPAQSSELLGLKCWEVLKQSMPYKGRSCFVLPLKLH